MSLPINTPDLGEIIEALERRVADLESISYIMGNPENENNPPLTITGLVATPAYILQAVSKIPVAQVTWSWDAIVQDTEDLTTDLVTDYMFSVTIAGAPQVAPFSTVGTATTTTVTDLPINTTIIGRVFAKTATGLVGPQALTTTNLLRDTTPPVQPSMPVVVPMLQGVSATWDGLDTLGNPMPVDFDYTEVHSSTTGATFTPTAATLVIRVHGANATPVPANATYSPIFVRFVSYDTSGNASVPSTAGTATPTKAVGSDLNVALPGDIAFRDEGNLLPDGSFESTFMRGARSVPAGWSYDSVAGFAAHGTWSVKATANGNYSFQGTSRGVDEFPVTGSTKYYFRVKVRGIAADGDVTMGVTWTDAAGGQTWSYPITNAVSTGAYVLFESVIAVPGTAVTAAVFLKTQSMTTGAWYFDACEVRAVVGTMLIEDLAVTNAKIGLLAVNNANIEDLDATKINAGLVDAERIVTGSMDSKEILGAFIKTALAGSRVELTPDGIQFFDQNNMIIVDMPTNPLLPVNFEGMITTDDITIEDRLTLQGITNEIVANAILTLGFDLKPPTSGPTLTTVWPYTTDISPVPIQGPESWRAVRHTDGIYHAIEHFNANQRRVMVFDPANPGAFVETVLSETGRSAQVDTVSGITLIGTKYWLLLQHTNGTWWLENYSVTTGSYGGGFEVSSAGNFSWEPALGLDGTKLLVANCTNAGKMSIREWDSTTGTVGTTFNSTETTQKKALYSVLKGNFDIGAARYTVTAAGTAYSYSAAGAVISNQVNESFPLPSYADSLTYDGTRFWSLVSKDTVLYKHSLIKYISGATDVLWATQAWYQTTGSLFTTVDSPKSSLTLTGSWRKYLSVKIPPIPVGGATPADSARIWLHRGTTSPADLNLYLANVPVAGTRTYLFDVIPTSGTNPPGATTFPNSIPGKIASAAKKIDGTTPRWCLNGDGTIDFGDGEIVSVADLTLAAVKGQFRMVQGNYGVFLRNDGSNTQFLITASGDQLGSWNTLRPFAINHITGKVTLANELAVGGNGMSSAINRAYYDAATGVTNVSSATFVTPTAGMIAQKVFVAPPSGIVLIVLNGYCRSTVAGSEGISGVQVRAGAVIGSGTVVLAPTTMMSNANVSWMKASGTQYLGGLTPGASYNAQHMIRSSNTNQVSFSNTELFILPQP